MKSEDFLYMVKKDLKTPYIYIYETFVRNTFRDFNLNVLGDFGFYLNKVPYELGESFQNEEIQSIVRIMMKFRSPSFY